MNVLMYFFLKKIYFIHLEFITIIIIIIRIMDFKIIYLVSLEPQNKIIMALELFLHHKIMDFTLLDNITTITTTTAALDINMANNSILIKINLYY